MPNILLMFLWYFVFLFSLVMHEASHAWASMKLGDYTAYEGGQVTLDPIPHMRQEPFGTILVPILTYFFYGWMMGWASAPYNFRWALNYPKSAALMSLAGPLANLGLVIISGIIIRIGILFGLFYPPDYMNFITIVSTSHGGLIHSLTILLSIAFSLNVLLFVFSLLPFPPLDSSGIVPLLFKYEEDSVKYLHFIRNPTFSIIGIIIAWHILDIIFNPIHTTFVNVLYSGLVYY